jgi:thiol-disulfide isomerase/thioredoxin
MVDFSKWRGQVLLLDFWATWSPVCRADLPARDALYQDLKDRGMVVVGLTMDRGTPADIQEAVRALPFSYPAVLADNRALELVGGIRPIPTRVLLGRDGKVHKQYMGALPMDGIRADVEELLKSVSLAE